MGNTEPWSLEGPQKNETFFLQAGMTFPMAYAAGALREVMGSAVIVYGGGGGLEY